MAYDKTQLISDLTAIYEDLDPEKTAAEKAEETADKLDIFVKTGTSKVDGTTDTTMITWMATVSTALTGLGIPTTPPTTITGKLE